MRSTRSSLPALHFVAGILLTCLSVPSALASVREGADDGSIAGSDSTPSDVAPAVWVPSAAPVVAGPDSGPAVPATAPDAGPGDRPTPELEAAALYRVGLFLMGQGRFDDARTLFQRVTLEYRETPSSAPAAQRLQELDKVAKQPAAAQPASREALANSGRAEFVVAETFIGGYLGVALPILAEADDPTAFVGGAMLGTAAGLGASLLYTRAHPLSSSQAALIYYSQLYGAGNLTMWSLALGAEDRTPVAMSVLGLGLGTVAGGLIGDRYDVPEGRVSLIASTGLWSTALTELALLTMTEGDLDEQVYQVAAPLAADIGLATAAYLSFSRDLQISRSRMRLINLGGVVGGLMAGGTAFLVEADDAQVAGGLVLAGALGGLGLSTYLTSDWDRTYHPELFARRPVNSLVAIEDGRFRLGDPMPQVTWRRAEERRSGGSRRLSPQVSLNLLGGEF